MGQLPQKHPLDGIRVVDFGHYWAAPMVGMLLADQGAEVLKIERPGGPPLDTPVNAYLNRGKQILTLDLKNDGQRQHAQALIADADVVIENFRPGVMDRLGLGAEAMSASNPALIYLSLPGFSSQDTANAGVRAFEGVLAAATGQFSHIHLLREASGLRPVYTPIPLASAYGATHGAAAVALALYEREQTGKGKIIEAPLAAAAMCGMGGILFNAAAQPPQYDMPRIPRVLKRYVFPWIQRIMRNADDGLQNTVLQFISSDYPPLFGSYRCKDGRWIFLMGNDHDRLPLCLFDELNWTEDLLEEGLVKVNPYEAPFLGNNLFDMDFLAPRWRKRLRKRLAACFLQGDADYWEQRLSGSGFACAANRSTREWMRRNELREAGIIVELEDAEYGKHLQPGIAVTLSSSPKPEYAARTAGRADASEPKLFDLRERSASMANPEQRLTSSGNHQGILSGIRVLDLSTMIAGPSCARTLAEYGAEVIKVDPPHPHAGPRLMCWLPMEVGQGKRSILLDLKQDAGMKIFWSLVDSSDVIVHNLRAGVPEKLGIGYEAVKARKPSVIYAQICAFDGPEPGPWAMRPGYDPVLQAATGIMSRYGGEGKPELHGIAGCVDYITGFNAAFGIALALLKRRRTKDPEGDLVKTSLCQGAQSLQVPFTHTVNDHPQNPEACGQDAVGEHALYRLYRARDGWLFLAAQESDVDRMARIPAFAALETANWKNDRQIASFLTRVLIGRTMQHWLDVLTAQDIGVYPVQSFEDIRANHAETMRAEQCAAYRPSGDTLGVIRVEDHPAGSPVETVPPLYVRPKDTPLRMGAPAPKPGAHTKEIVMELGYSEEEVADLLRRGAISKQLHDKYLPE